MSLVHEMSPGSQVASGYRPGSARERAVSTVLSAAIIALIVALAIWQSGLVEKAKRPQSLVSFDVVDNGKAKKAGEKHKQAKKAQEHKRKDEPRHSVTRPVPPPPVPVPRDQDQGFTFLRLSKEDMASADIGRMAKSPATGSRQADAGGNGSAVQGPGEGPGGAVLYNADWYRKPTDAQLATYMPQTGVRNGWGLIACRTVERYRVEDCQILGESPRGSGYGRAVQDAAWQFLVIPPRVNGKPQVGSWVRIRIEYTERGAEASG